MKFVDRMKGSAADRSELSDAQGERAAQKGVPTQRQRMTKAKSVGCMKGEKIN